MRIRIAVLAVAALASAAVAATAGAKGPGLTLELAYPKASPLPHGTRILKAPAGSWRGDQSNIAVSGSALFVGTSTGIQRVDARTNVFARPLARDVEAADIAYADGKLWASDYDFDVVREIDPATGRVVKIHLPAGSAPVGILAAAGSIWVAEHHGGSVARIDPASHTIVARVAAGIPGASGPQGMSFGAGTIWVSVPDDGEVVRIDPATNRVVARIAIPEPLLPCGGIAVGRTAAWVTGCLDDPWVARISIATDKVVRLIDMHGLSIEPVAQGNTAWFLVGRDPDSGPPSVHAYLVRLDDRDRVLRRYDLGPRFTPGGTAIAFGSLWASSFTTPWVARLPLP